MGWSGGASWFINASNSSALAMFRQRGRLEPCEHVHLSFRVPFAADFQPDLRIRTLCEVTFAKNEPK
jgi:hypothetical protein